MTTQVGVASGHMTIVRGMTLDHATITGDRTLGHMTAVAAGALDHVIPSAGTVGRSVSVCRCKAGAEREQAGQVVLLGGL